MANVKSEEALEDQVSQKLAFCKIEFEDDGQDFLIWTLAEDGEVLECMPFQGWAWEGRYVVEMEELTIGGYASLVASDGSLLTIKYPLIAVTYLLDADGGNDED